ncbi:TPA: 50S ribosomal protein L17 [candidate division WWE3 bacterium]|uniref:Large ribosomal subunit protein bL17 n=1 Tax=candidate division WWE3 bacterium TaxID=2053526 RepID=A0A656PPI2_UNCKA|nr:50S ribosomal protein L17 [candidate division WWE3 bacterium RAAC2_WWE3_1]KKS29089.1 MAG: 50S ribosomal protein L17 [candidate division WWE3 bacterium GW2011_GWB1_42_117]KKS55148.1 MAG: 50S ribosomal protein L17 [candidate division WWE3 bacterium GW2011_GWD2_42_34]KKT05698.1 MAG: 50S ribosomal protein L17 [candidate division WWE3 bacterium GW2011_GWE2_43_18]KKT07412.1 MAG: 50S ribosomal protein L17 [candidate division WWE3 bacterium GW2011_GWF2_43_18]KKT08210.1 MAG: 50S ribosomal protein L1
MRHRVAKKKMGRPAGHRVALEKNLAVSLIIHEKIETTLEKAKFVRPFVERIITRAKKGYLSKDRIAVFNTIKELRKAIGNEEAIKKLMDSVASRFEKRMGGYTRIIKTGNRGGDNANTARIELLPAEKKEEAPKEKKKAVAKKSLKKEKKNDK